MKFNKVLQEATYFDTRDHGTGEWIYYPDGRKKHVKEETSIYILNFAVRTLDNRKIVEINYYGRTSEYKPVNKKGTHDEVYITKHNHDIAYKENRKTPVNKSFDTFEGFYDFMMKEARKGNMYPRNLMKKVVSRGWQEVGRKQQKHFGSPKINALDTVASEVDRLEQAVKFMMREQQTSHIQEFVVVRKTPYTNKVSYGESHHIRPKRVFREIDQILSA